METKTKQKNSLSPQCNVYLQMLDIHTIVWLPARGSARIKQYTQTLRPHPTRTRIKLRWHLCQENPNLLGKKKKEKRSASHCGQSKQKQNKKTVCLHSAMYFDSDSTELLHISEPPIRYRGQLPLRFLFRAEGEFLPTAV